MTYKGIVKNKTIVLDKSVDLPDGTEVEVVPIGCIDSEDPIFGTWQDDRSAEEIINDIKSSRHSQKKDINL